MEKRVYGVEEFLSRPKRLEEEIRGDIDHIASLRSIVEKTTTQLSFTSGRNPSKNEKAFESVMIQITEEEAALAEKQKRLLELKLEVENFINSISEKDLRRILRLKFITGLTISEIRSSMYLSRPGVYRLYEKAIDEAAKVFHSVEG